MEAPAHYFTKPQIGVLNDSRRDQALMQIARRRIALFEAIREELPMTTADRSIVAATLAASIDVHA